MKGILNFLIISLLVLAVGCSTGKRGERAHEVPSTHVSKPKKHPDISHKQKALIKEADTWLGTPYLYGGETKGQGVDCSGLVMRLYLDVLDTKIPRNSVRQAEFCEKIEEKDVRVGDLVFFATGKDSTRVTHVGMMVDTDGTFIHASSSKGVVRSSMKNPWYRRRFLMYGRIKRAT